MLVRSWIVLLLLSVGLILAIGQACSKVQLVPYENPNPLFLSSHGELCVPEPLEIGKYTKMLFVMDVSGSNAETDPGKTRRLGALNQFFAQNRANPFIEWGLIVFSGNTEGGARSLVLNNQGGLIRFFAPAGDFEAALNQFQGVADSGATPYVAALNRARNGIETELELARRLGQDVVSFHVVFISDGVPMPASENTDAEIFSIIQAMLSATENRLKLSTVFYNVGGQDQAAIGRLQEMARLGNGRFQDASNGEAINIQDLIVSGRSQENYFIKDFFSYNLNSAICDDGKIDADSDADGLCDRDEVAYNQLYADKIRASNAYRGKQFSPTHRNSFDQRFNDLFIYKHLIDGESLPSCDLGEQIAWDNDGDLLNECEEAFLTAKNPQGPNLNWTQEMIRLGSRGQPANYDSDGDGIIDGLEFMFFKNKGYPLNFNSINARLNQRSLYDYFYHHQSFLKPESSLPYQLKVQWIRRNERGLNCYHVTQEHLPLYPVQAFNHQLPPQRMVTPQTNSSVTTPMRMANLSHGANENLIFVYYIATTQNDPDGKGIMRYSIQKRALSLSGQGVSFNDLPFEEVRGR